MNDEDKEPALFTIFKIAMFGIGCFTTGVIIMMVIIG